MLTTTQGKYQEIHSIAEDLYRQAPDWVTFFREVLGVDGIVRKALADQDLLTRFEVSEEQASIQRMLKNLREKRTAGDNETEPTRVITVRLPKSVHEFLITEAGEKSVSMNKLCISKLLQIIEDELVPRDPPPKRRRRNRISEQVTTEPMVAQQMAAEPVMSAMRDGLR